MDLATVAMLLIQKNPQMQNNPMAQQFMSILQSGNQAQGEQMARNICSSYGLTPEQALQQATRYFSNLKL